MSVVLYYLLPDDAKRPAKQHSNVKLADGVIYIYFFFSLPPSPAKEPPRCDAHGAYVALRRLTKTLIAAPF